MIPLLSPSWWRLRAFRKAIRRQSDEAVEVVKQHWITYVRTFGVSNDLLAKKIYEFVPITIIELRMRFPILMFHPEMVRQTIAAGIVESRTHDPSLVGRAYRESDYLFLALAEEIREAARDNR